MFNFAFYLCRAVVPLKLLCPHGSSHKLVFDAANIIKKSTEKSYTLCALIRSFHHHDVCVIAIFNAVNIRLSISVRNGQIDVLKQGAGTLGGLSTLS